MKKLTAILGLAAMVGGLTLSGTAYAQTMSSAPQATTDTTPQTAAQKRAAKKAAKAAAAPAPAAAAAPAPAAKPVPAASSMAAAPAATPKAPKASLATANATPAQIADAKSKGMVWMNTESKVYHKDGQFYGATKHGQFMSEADAMKAGGHLAKPSATAKK